MLSLFLNTSGVSCLVPFILFNRLNRGKFYRLIFFFRAISFKSPFSLLLPHILQMIPPLLALFQNRSKLKLYIAHLTDLCHDRDPSILSQLTPPAHYHHSDPEDWEEDLQKMSAEQVMKKLLSHRDIHL